MDKKLDFERKTAYQLTIQAEDSGSPVRYDTAFVSIDIEDVNDSPPDFLHSPYLAYRPINGTTGDIFLHSALDRETFSSDPDLGLNSRLGEEAASFTIDPASGEVRTWWDLDREEQEQATLTITDNAGPGDFLPGNEGLLLRSSPSL